MTKPKKDHRDFLITFVWGTNSDNRTTRTIRSTNKSIPLLSVIKVTGACYFRSTLITCYLIHSGSLKTEITEFRGIEPLNYSGTNYDQIKDLIKSIKIKYKNCI